MKSTAIALIDEQDAGQERKGSVAGPRSLTAEMRIFVDAFLSNGGKSTEAAIAAGVEPGKAAMQACRWLCREAVAAHIKNQAGRFVQSTIPVAIQTLVEIAGDPTALRKDRIKAANSLLEMAEMGRAPGGFQVNLAVVNGSQAQQIIAEVHERRQRRLSDIPTAMSDTLQSDMRAIEQAIDVTPADHPGGVELQGPAAGTCPLPGYSSENPPVSGISEPDPADEFRKAFDDEGDE